MKLTVVGKYPPIEGGVSSRMYWLARALAERGMQIDIVTNAGRVENAYRIPLDLNNPETKAAYERPNLAVFSLTGAPPAHIPYSESYLSRLVNLGLKVVGERGSDLIYANYLEPYGAAALYLKQLTGVPYAVQHAGSDIYRLLPHEDFGLLLGNVLRHADGAFMSESLRPLAEKLRIHPDRLFRNFGRGIDTNAFSPEGPRFDFARFKLPEPPGVPLITYMGKLGKFKGVGELCRALMSVSADFRLLLLTDGEASEKLDALLAGNPAFAQKVIRVGFVPPWEIPAVLRASAVVVHLEYNFPIPIHTPLQPFEAMAAGTPILLSTEMHRKIRPVLPESASLLSHIENPADTKALADAFERMLGALDTKRTEALAIREELLKRLDWKLYVEKYELVFSQLAKKPRFRFFR